MPPHENTTIGKRFLISMSLTAMILVAEVAGGLYTGSLALLSDAAHVFMDVFALVLSYLALRLSALPPDDRHTFGFHRLEVLAALVNGVTLGAIAIEIFSEAWRRWQNPAPVKSLEMLVIAVIGLVVNLVVISVLGEHGHKHEPALESDAEHNQAPEDINIRSAYLHVLGDAISSVGVIAAAALIWFTGWSWVDPLISMAIGVLIVVSSWRVLRQALHILVEGVPEHLSIEKIGKAMSKISGVQDIHDLHVWSICSGHISLSAHVVTRDLDIAAEDCLMAELKQRLSSFGIEHTTIQFEHGNCGQGRVVEMV